MDGIETIDQLTDDQIAALTPEQIEQLETNPENLKAILAGQPVKDKPKQEDVAGVTNDAGEEEPIVLTKSGKGVIPYEQHKELRVANATLRDQLAETQKTLAELQATKDAAVTTAQKDDAQDAIQAHLDVIKEDMPDLYAIVNHMSGQNKALRDELAAEKKQRETKEADQQRATQQTVEEQVNEAKDNNPDLLAWEAEQGEAWDEALKQDEILRTNPKWASKTYPERFDEVVRRVRAIMPEAPQPKKTPDPKQTAAKADAKVEAAAVKKPTTLSDIPGSTPPNETDQIDNLPPHELVARLMKMTPQKAAAMRAELLND